MAVLAVGLIGGALASSVGLSFSLGFAVFGTIAQLLLQPHPKAPTFKAAGSAWGRTWPICYNYFRVAGQLIQASDITGHEDKFKKGQVAYSQTIAIGFCEGEHNLGRLWADGKVIYDARPQEDPPTWSADTVYAAGDPILPYLDANVQLIATVNGTSGLVEPTWDLAINASNVDNTEVWIAAPYERPNGSSGSDPDAWVALTHYGAGSQVAADVTTIKMVAIVSGTSGSTTPTWPSTAGTIVNDGTVMWVSENYFPSSDPTKAYDFNIRIYNGDEDQLPDSALEELVGTGFQPGYRGLFYIVLENFDISKYGNRIPNFEAEMLPPPSLPYLFSSNPGQTYTSNRTGQADVDGHFGYFWGNQIGSGASTQWSIVKTDLRNGAISLVGPTVTKTTNWPQIADGPPMPSPTGDKVWYYSFDLSRSKDTIKSADIGTLALVDSFDFTGIFALSNSPAISADGLMGCMYDGDNSVILFNLSTGNYNVINMNSGTHGPFDATDDMWLPTFDNANNLWFYGEKGRFWKIPVTQFPSGGPTLGIGKYITARSNDGASFGPCCYNPDTDTVYARSPNGSGGYYVIPVNATTEVVSTILLIPNGATYVWSGGGDQNGWHTGRYQAYVPTIFGSRDCGALYDTQTFTYTEYPWSYWDESAPFVAGDVWANSSAMAAGNGSAITTVSARGLSSTNPDYMDLAFFPLTSGIMSLADICADVSQRVGLTSSDYDYSALATTFPRGCAVLDRGPAREFLEAMQPAFFYDLTDIGDSVVGSLRASASLVVTIPEADLGASQDGAQIIDKISTQRNNDLEIPQDLDISFYDAQHDYLQGNVPARRSEITHYSSGRNTLSVPVVMTPGEAANCAERTLYMTWIEREQKKLSVPLQYLKITPADFISAVKNSVNNFLRITKATLNPNMVIELEAVSEDLGTYSLTAPPGLQDITSGVYTPQTVHGISSPVLIMMDVAPLHSAGLNETAIYAAGSVVDTGGFDGIQVWESSDNSTFVAPTGGIISQKSTLMLATSVLGNCVNWETWDRVNTLSVTLLNGAIGSATEDDVIGSLSTNLFFISDGAGGGEFFQAATVTQVSGQNYILSDLVRGRLGSERYIGTAVGGENVIQVNVASLADIPYSSSDINATRYWKGQNDSAFSNITATQTLVMDTNRRKCWAPYYLAATRDGSGNITITGKRRMRAAGQALWTPTETDTPVTMEIDIYNSAVSPSAVVRTLTATLTGSGSGITNASTFTAYYSAADQVTDFGSAQASVYLMAYQKNSIIGRGFPGSATV